ncbi:hypothetical protein RJ641_031386 [Dillenia turbinata]|uniref:RIN4 pathogenic type III effector avirulence factor Avr cleavage site domain-containing protein n=1 Tax=Dillenia turbinata TaxID=194707 RepID=A0AAN8ZKU9_9MAGN
MDEYYNIRNHVPVFGSWDCSNEDLPFTQCFESARQAGLLHHCYSHSDQSEDRDRYLSSSSDHLYPNLTTPPALIVVPGRRVRGRQPRVKPGTGEAWVCEYDFDCDRNVKKPATPLTPSPPRPAPKPKPIDEDLYQIPPECLKVKPRRKRSLGLFTSCLQPTCVL